MMRIMVCRVRHTQKSIAKISLVSTNGLRVIEVATVSILKQKVTIGIRGLSCGLRSNSKGYCGSLASKINLI